MGIRLRLGSHLSLPREFGSNEIMSLTRIAKWVTAVVAVILIGIAGVALALGWRTHYLLTPFDGGIESGVTCSSNTGVTGEAIGVIGSALVEASGFVVPYCTLALFKHCGVQAAFADFLDRTEITQQRHL